MVHRHRQIVARKKDAHRRGIVLVLQNRHAQFDPLLRQPFAKGRFQPHAYANHPRVPLVPQLVVMRDEAGYQFRRTLPLNFRALQQTVKKYLQVVATAVRLRHNVAFAVGYANYERYYAQNGFLLLKPNPFEPFEFPQLV